MNHLLRRLINPFRRTRIDQDVDSELNSHIQLKIDDYIGSGMPPVEARRRALLEFGNRRALKEDTVAVHAGLFLELLAQDLRYATRQMRRAPGFTATAILTLAIGIAANVVVFGVLNALVLQPLNVGHPDRLYQIVHKEHGRDNESYPNYIDYRRLSHTFSDMAAYRLVVGGLSTGTSAHKCWVMEVSGSYFATLAVQPSVGRFFRSNDERGGPNSAPYIVLTRSFWQSFFRGDPRIIGTKVDVNGHPFTVVGIAGAGFYGSEKFLRPDFFIPLIDEQQIEGWNFLEQRGVTNVQIIGSLKPGVTAAQATANLNAIATQLSKQYRDDAALTARLIRPGLMADLMTDPLRTFLFVVSAIALLVLLAACMNLASIFAARASDRTRELAIRLAIGSSRRHVVRQLILETTLLSLAGGAIGLLIDTVLLRAFNTWRPIPEIPLGITVSVDGAVLTAVLALSLLSGILPALAAAGHVWRMDAVYAMKPGPAHSTFRRFAIRDLLLAAQISVCALLLTASLVALRGMDRSLHAPLGFEPQGVVLAQTDFQMTGYPGSSVLPMQKRMLEAVRRIPGVSSLGMVDSTPLNIAGSGGAVYRDGTTDFRPTNAVTHARFYSISPGYLEAARTRLLAGRNFTWHDDAHAPQVSIVNETLARKLFGSPSAAVGKRFYRWENTPSQIVGIVEDGKYTSLTEPAADAMFFPMTQSSQSFTTLVVRSPLPPSQIEPTLSRTLASIDPRLPFTIESWPEALRMVLFPARAASVTLGVMGLMSALLAITGVFGMAGYSVSKRRKEFGIRIALGSHPVQLVREAVSRPVGLLIAGSVLGIGLSIAASQILAAIVYSATPRDPVVLCGVILAMSVIGVCATLGPARRALSVDPANLLREDA